MNRTYTSDYIDISDKWAIRFFKYEDNESEHVMFYDKRYANSDYEGWEVYRYKGLGEQSPEELWESTMDPETRALIPLTLEDAEQVRNLYSVIMGNSPAERKKFIMTHARNYALTQEEVGEESLGGEE